MSKQDELNWSADLRRISLWLQMGNFAMADMFIKRGQKLYSKGKRIADRDWSWWLKEIKNKDNLKASERALTWSLLLR